MFIIFQLLFTSRYCFGIGLFIVKFERRTHISSICLKSNPHESFFKSNAEQLHTFESLIEMKINIENKYRRKI